MHEPLHGDDFSSEFPSESELASAPSTPSPISRDSKSPVAPSPRPARNATPRTFEIVPAAPIGDRAANVPPEQLAGEPSSWSWRPLLIQRAIVGGARQLGRTASAARMVCHLVLVVSRLVLRCVFLAVSGALHAGRQMLSSVGPGARVLVDRFLVAYRDVRHRMPAPAFRSRIPRPAFRPVAAAFLSGVTVGALTMALMPRAVGREAAPGGAAVVDTELHMAADATAAGAIAGTGMLSSAAAKATTGEVQRASLTAAVSRESSVANAPEPPADSTGGAAAPRAAVPQRPAFRGSLTVRSHPAGASVFINGQPVGKTPLVLRNQAVGSRSVRITMDGHEVWSTAARVVAYQQSVVQANLRRLPATPATQE